MGDRFTILHAEDDTALLSSTKRFFARIAPHYALIQVDNGDEAQELLSNPETRIDLLLTDIHMPGLADMQGPTGHNIARAAREHRPGIPVVFNTGMGGEEERIILQQEPNTAYTLKPTNNLALIQFIHYIHHVSRPQSRRHLVIGDSNHLDEVLLEHPDRDVLLAGNIPQARILLNNIRIDHITQHGKVQNPFAHSHPYINQSTPKLDRPGAIIILTGPKAAGKDSIARALELSLPYTGSVGREHTRPPRDREFSKHPILFRTTAPLPQSNYASNCERGQYQSAIALDSIVSTIRSKKDALIVAASPQIVNQLRASISQSELRNHPVYTVLITVDPETARARARLRGTERVEEDIQAFYDLNPDIVVENQGTEHCRPYLPSQQLLKDLEDTTLKIANKLPPPFIRNA